MPAPRGAAALGVAALLVVSVVLYAVDPARYTLTPPCAFRTFTGLACPGCGATRAAHALLHGHLGRAFDLNPWAFVITPGLALFLVVPQLAAAGQARRARTVLAWSGLVITIGFWIWRNTAAYPFARVV